MNFIVKLKNELIETLTENKKLILICYSAFLIILIGSIFLAPSIANNMPNISETNNSANKENTTSFNDCSALDLFIHNEVSNLIIYISSIFFGIPSIIMLIYDAINIGLVTAIFIKIGKGTLFYVIYLIPHGIFEITGTVISYVAGLILFKFIWKFIKTAIKKDGNFKNHIKSSFKDNKKILKQSIILLIFTTILLLIAAPIEAYVSIPFTEFISSFL